MSVSTSGSGNLPVQLTRFVDRESDAAALEAVFGHARIVTLTGAPGCGKSRLGIEIGRRLASRFADGVWLVELAPVAERERVAGAIGFVLEIGERPGRPMIDALVEELADSELLLILDNCEHVAEKAAAVASRVVEGCPSVRVLATSRLPLGLPGEHVWSVAPLEVEPAVELFVDRGRLASNDFRIDDPARDQIGRICDRLDGLPLAIELVAAWTRVLSPSQIADRLDDARLLMTTAGRSAPPRQETMEATVDWSYRLLAPAEQILFARLSVFAGGFDLAAAEAVAGPADEVLPALTALVDHSLVQAEPASAESMRYRVLEPLRRYGTTALSAAGDLDEVRKRHAEHYVDVAARCDAELGGTRRAAALRVMELDDGNFAAALEWARTRCSDLALRLCAALARFWELRGPVNECRALIEEMLESESADRRLRATVLSRAAGLAWRQQDYPSARALLEESLSITRLLGDQLAVARRLRALALVRIFEGDIEAAAELCEQSITMFRAHGDDWGVASVLLQLGWARYLGAGDAATGDAHMREALSISRALGYGTGLALSLLGLAYRAQVAGDVASARGYLVDAIAAFGDAGMLGSGASWLWASAVLAADERRYDGALRLVGGAQALSRRRGVELERQFFNVLRPRIDRAFREREGVADRLVSEGSRMGLDDLVAEAVAEPAASDEPLSPREREVVQLVARGLSNTEIAEQLFISKRTVESHVDNIKQKLGHGSRSQVIAWAVREALDTAVS